MRYLRIAFGVFTVCAIAVIAAFMPHTFAAQNWTAGFTFEDYESLHDGVELLATEKDTSGFVKIGDTMYQTLAFKADTLSDGGNLRLKISVEGSFDGSTPCWLVNATEATTFIDSAECVSGIWYYRQLFVPTIGWARTIVEALATHDSCDVTAGFVMQPKGQ